MHQSFPDICRCAAVSLAIVLAGVAPRAGADDGTPTFRIGGFGTLGTTYHTHRGVEYVRSQDQPNGSRGGRLATGVDSLVGAQLDFSASDRVDGVLQVISRPRPDNTWTPYVSWAFLRYSPDETFEVRAGRIGVDSQLGSDSRLIGYSYLPVRPSPEVLGMTTQDYFDGLDATYRQPLGDGLASFKVFGGRQRAKVASTFGEVRVPQLKVLGLLGGYAWGGVQARVVVGGARLDDNGDIQPLLDGLRATGIPQAVAAADRLGYRDRSVVFAQFDAAYERGPLKLQGSYFSQRAPDDSAVLVDARAYSLLAGYRFGKLTPYVTHGHMHSSNVDLDPGLPAIPALAALSQGVDALVRAAEFNQESTGVGVRWDLVSNGALKFQVDHVVAGATPLVRAVSAPADPSVHLTLFSVTFDFIF